MTVARMRRARLWIGTSGWHYDHWRGLFYPPALPRREWFSHYAAHFDTVEIDSTFYRLPEEATFDAWREAAPAGFRYALKLSRYLTHLKHLRDPAPPLRLFLERARRLRDRLGPILVQLPPRWAPDLPRLAGFLAAAPRGQRFAVELRDPRWLSDATFALLRRRGAALCIHDAIEDHPREATADWVYLRFHGAGSLYAGSYPPQRLAAEARRIRAWLRRGLDVHAYFNNDAGGHAVRNALQLRRYVERRSLPERRQPASRIVRAGAP
jgi:uncharacterized protein YecE (DUF72 family)